MPSLVVQVNSSLKQVHGTKKSLIYLKKNLLTFSEVLKNWSKLYVCVLGTSIINRISKLRFWIKCSIVFRHSIGDSQKSYITFGWFNKFIILSLRLFSFFSLIEHALFV